MTIETRQAILLPQANRSTRNDYEETYVYVVHCSNGDGQSYVGSHYPGGLGR